MKIIGDTMSEQEKQEFAKQIQEHREFLDKFESDNFEQIITTILSDTSWPLHFPKWKEWKDTHYPDKSWGDFTDKEINEFCSVASAYVREKYASKTV